MGGIILSCEERDRRLCGAGMRMIRTMGGAGGAGEEVWGQAMWLKVAVLSSDYLDGVLGRLSLPAPCESKSICFKA